MGSLCCPSALAFFLPLLLLVSTVSVPSVWTTLVHVLITDLVFATLFWHNKPTRNGFMIFPLKFSLFPRNSLLESFISLPSCPSTYPSYTVLRLPQLPYSTSMTFQISWYPHFCSWQTSCYCREFLNSLSMTLHDHITLQIEEGHAFATARLWRCNKSVVQNPETRKEITHYQCFSISIPPQATGPFTNWNAQKAFVRSVFIKVSARYKRICFGN